MHNVVVVVVVVDQPRVYDGGGLLVHFPLSPSPVSKPPRLYLEAEVLGERQYVQITNSRNRGLAL